MLLSVLCQTLPARLTYCPPSHPPTRVGPAALQQIISEMHSAIRDEAKRDAAKWQNPGGAGRWDGWSWCNRMPGCGEAVCVSLPFSFEKPAGDPDRGYQQLVSEQVPIRQRQLYETYGPRSPIPLIPGATACVLASIIAWPRSTATLRG